jgi:hypothetical protein
MEKLIASLFSISVGLVPMDYDTKPPADWPKLDERISYIELEAVPRFCGVPKELVSRVQGCSKIDFYYNLCMIHLGNNSPELLAHEREHCLGFNHRGEGGKSAKAWTEYKATGKGSVYDQPF